MKTRLLQILLATLCIVLQISCSGTNPEDVAVQFVKLQHNGEFKKAYSMVQDYNMNVATDKDRKEFKERKIKELKEKGGIKEIKIQESEVLSVSAIINLTVFYGDGTSRDYRFRMTKNDDMWKILF